MVSVNQFQNDSVTKFNPISFAGIFIREMRKQKGIANIPSIRSTIAIPKFLTARYWRKESLDPMDYFHAAVITTPYEDQTIARKVAKELLFPHKQVQTSKPNSLSLPSNPDITTNISGVDQILNELDEAGFDDLLDMMESGADFDKLMEEQEDLWEYVDKLLQSQDPLDLARINLMQELGSEYSIVQYHLNNSSLIDNYIKKRLQDTSGNWKPNIFKPAVDLGLDNTLKKNSQLPWEIATSMAVTQDMNLGEYLSDLLDDGDAHTLGTTLRYLSENNHFVSEDWINQAFDKIKDLSDYYEMLTGMKEYRPPPPNTIQKAAQSNIKKNLDLSDRIADTFSIDLGKEIFEEFKKEAENSTPSVQQVLDATYDDHQKSWEDILEQAISKATVNKTQKELEELSLAIKNHQSPRLTPEMKRSKTYQTKEVATQCMESIDDKEKFLPQLDYFTQNGILPDYGRTVSTGKNFQIIEEDIAEYFQSPLKLLESYIDNDIRNVSKYDKITRKIGAIPKQNMNELVGKVARQNNTVGLAALGASDLGAAAKATAGVSMASGEPASEILVDSLDKSIGGGTNLLKQWFLHRNHLPAALKERLRYMMKELLLEIGMDWANRGTGSSEEGIIPVNQTRPFRPGDELDSIDIEATLETLLMSGKKLEQITHDELMVTETSKGKTALGVLIDISGSMSGKQLAMCAIAVVMLLGKLQEKEIAIALFESNTHEIKGFETEVELDSIANELLDLKARGGTRADQALRWITTEFENVIDSEVKILYFLSDFYLAENPAQLTNLCDPLQNLDVKLLTAYHGSYDNTKMQRMIDILTGSSMRITNFDTLPKIISDAIMSIS